MDRNWQKNWLLTLTYIWNFRIIFALNFKENREYFGKQEEDKLAISIFFFS